MKQFIKFCTVGAINTLITFCCFYILNSILNINYLVSSFFAYAAGISNSYILNRKWTFQNRNKMAALQLVKFVIIYLISLGINLAVMYQCVNRFSINENISQVIAIGFSTIVNYVGSKTLVFKEAD